MIKYEDLLGKQYEVFARGPDKYDCYGLIIEMYKRNLKTVPDYPSPEGFEKVSLEIFKQLKKHWRLIEEKEATKTLICFDDRKVFLKPNVAVVLRIGKFGCHIGYILDNKNFIHTWEKSGGVLVERLDFWKNHIIGAYDYVG